MARSAGQIRPGRYLAFFVLIVVGLYSLVFLTGDRNAAPKLGIDLQGGTRVTLTARTPDGGDPSQESLNQARQIIETRVNGIGVSGAKVVLDGDNVVITVPGEQGDQAKNLGRTAKLAFRKVVGTEPVVPPAQPPTPPNTSGLSDEEIAKQIQDAKAVRQNPQLLPADPNNPEAAAAAQQAARKALDSLTCVSGANDPLAGNDDPALPLVTCDEKGTEKLVLEPVFLPGTEIETAQASAPMPPQKPGWTVELQFKAAGGQTWGEFTSQNVNQRAAFVLDTQVVSAPTIQNAIFGGITEISGQFTQEEAKNLADVLKYGSLPLSFSSSDATTVSATLGLASLEAGLIAGAVGLAIVFIYCLIYYRLLGILTILSLVLSGLLVYAVLVLLGRWIGYTLDLAGVAGLIIAIGITADSFVIYFERLKDELREGKTFRSAVPRGWVRARRTILASDAVSFLAAAVLYILAVGEVKGFAFTLGMSTVLDLVVVYLVTHPLVALISGSKRLSNPKFLGLGAAHRVGAQRKPTVVSGRRRAATKEA